MFLCLNECFVMTDGCVIKTGSSEALVVSGSGDLHYSHTCYNSDY